MILELWEWWNVFRVEEVLPRLSSYKRSRCWPDLVCCSVLVMKLRVPVVHGMHVYNEEMTLPWSIEVEKLLQLFP